MTRAVFEYLFESSFPAAYPDWLKTVDGIQLELDGFNEGLGIAFEHQGAQHYREIEYFTKTTSFEKRVEYDALKLALCGERGILLICVPQVEPSVGPVTLTEEIKKLLRNAGIDVPDKAGLPDFCSAYATDPAVERLLKLRNIASAHGGKCLETSYMGGKTPHLFECAVGHRWEAHAETIFRGGWCPYCAAERKAITKRTSIETLQSAATAHGGKLISSTYRNGHEKLEWECERGHRFFCSWNSVRDGTWCTKCQVGTGSPESRQVALDELGDIARARGGVLLSTEYNGSRGHLQWACSKGHTWMATPNNVRNGTWCPICAGNSRDTLSAMRELASSNGGECLSPVYVNARSKLKWRCGEGHEWEAVPYSIKAGTWCPICAGKRPVQPVQ